MESEKRVRISFGRRTGSSILCRNVFLKTCCSKSDGRGFAWRAERANGEVIRSSGVAKTQYLGLENHKRAPRTAQKRIRSGIRWDWRQNKCMRREYAAHKARKK